jgi:N-acyl-D-aspartate/D-glutamate deacylase
VSQVNANDLLIRGGTVVDGAGSAPVIADVRIRKGQIAEIGPSLDPAGEPTLDVSGAYVTPGLIESHTHYDAATWWDPDCDPMPAHGCTTMVLSNCGLGLAPLRPAESTDLVSLFAFIEDIPVEAFQLGVPWTWNTWPEYFDAASRHATAANYVGFAPYQMLRTWVMGPAAWERPARPDERDRLCAALDEALLAGAIGLSFSEMDTDSANRPVPSRLADDTELTELIAVLARRNAVLQYVPRFLQPDYFFGDIQRISRLTAATGVRVLLAGGYALEEGAHDNRERLHTVLEDEAAKGADLYVNFSPRPSHVNMHFERSIMWSGVAAWHDYVNAPLERKRTLLNDASWRQAARLDWDACTYTLAPIRKPDRMLLIGGSHSGESLAKAIARTGQHPSDIVADWLIETDSSGNIRTPDRPMDAAAAAAIARSARGIPGASDAGAHVQMFSGAGDGTYFLKEMAHDSGQLRIEEAVHAVTGRLASFFGIRNRGVLRPGAVADLAVFRLEELTAGVEVQRHDLPGGAWRYSRTPGGYRATIVSGVPTWLDGASTGRRPGAMLAGDSGPDRTPTVV